MINFRALELKDKEWMDGLVFGSGERSFEYVFTNQWAWIDSYKPEVAEVEGCFSLRACYGNMAYYLCPVGGDERAAVLRLAEDAAARGHEFNILSVSPKHRPKYEEWFPGAFEFEEDRDNEDYLYAVEKLADLAGKKLHGKRNHINKFLSLYPDWSFEPITEENKHLCLCMDNLWMKENMDNDDLVSVNNERMAIKRCIDNFDYLGLEGGLLRVGDRVVAMTIGEPINDSDSYDVHFEKADLNYEGSFTMINRSFARWIRDNHPDIRYINREEDMGLPGLRQAKESYKPDKMMVKYTARLVGEIR
ncbi:MAG: DUF2156 domain-containing protein [Firmicutes bacterium]|nr:DUF2156 domain-containing protein [Bacillota bacterium]